MLDICHEYMERHGEDLIEAAAAFTLALVGGDPMKPQGYTFENAVMATVEGFELQPKEMIQLVARLTAQATA